VPGEARIRIGPLFPGVAEGPRPLILAVGEHGRPLVASVPLGCARVGLHIHGPSRDLGLAHDVHSGEEGQFGSEGIPELTEDVVARDVVPPVLIRDDDGPRGDEDARDEKEHGRAAVYTMAGEGRAVGRADLGDADPVDFLGLHLHLPREISLQSQIERNII